MKETILNIYLIIENYYVKLFLAKSYEMEGDDQEKIAFLKSRVKEDFFSAEEFSAPFNSLGKYMKYRKFSKLEQHGMQFQLFEEIFKHFNVPEHPLICVTPVVDGKIYNGEENSQ